MLTSQKKRYFWDGNGCIFHLCDFSVFTFKVCRRTKSGFSFFSYFFISKCLKKHLIFPSEQSFRNSQQWSKTKTGDVAYHPLAKPPSVNVQYFTRKVQLIFFPTFLWACLPLALWNQFLLKSLIKSVMTLGLCHYKSDVLLHDVAACTSGAKAVFFIWLPKH